MASYRRHHPALSRSAVIGILLVLTLALAGVMAYQAVDATRSHRAIAESVLKEHALFAAWELNSALRRDVQAHLLSPGIEVVAKAGGVYLDVPLKALKPFGLVARDFEWWLGLENLDFFFRYDLASQDFQSSGVTNPQGPIRDWLIQMAERQATAPPEGEKAPPWAMTFHGTGADQRLVVMVPHPVPGPEADLVFGFQLRMDALIAVLSKLEEATPLLPPALIAGKDPGELLAFTIRTPGGQEIFKSDPQFDSPYQVEDTVGQLFGALSSQVRLSPDAADLVLIGGLPRSRLPTILGLLALASALVLAAIFQIRREHELALLRTDFVSSVSHQLRTPLAQIRMFGETLLLGRVRSEEEERKSLEIIVKEAQRLTHQVDNVLLFSRAQRRDMEIHPVDTALAPLIQDVLESFCPLAEVEGCKVVGRLEAGLKARVDPAAIRQVLLNLLENAVKYGPAEQTVEMRLRRGPPGAVHLIVEDEGEGIPKDRREEVFSPYARLDRHRESAVAGSGIGLAVVRELVHRQGGSVWVEDAPGGGARFVVEFPELKGDPPTSPDGR